MALVFCCFGYSVHAQEICNNGLDDDNDGYVDCFDSDCAGSALCTGLYFGGVIPICQYAPTPSPPFLMNLLWSTDSTTYPLDARRTPMVGDLDQDGIPEVVTGISGTVSSAYVFSGSDGVLERTIVSPATAALLNAYAIADVDNDGFGEIILVAQNTLGRQLYCYEHTGTLKWTSALAVGYVGADEAWTPLIADFNEDGVPEIYLGNQIFGSVTGNLIAQAGFGSPTGAHAASPNEPFSIAADVLPTSFCTDCDGLELVAGNTVYSVDVGLGTMTTQTTIAGFPDGLTSLADVDRDGDIDAVVVGQNGSGKGIVYAWDLQTVSAIGTAFQIDLSNAAVGPTLAGGMASVGDFNNDNITDIAVVGNDVIVAIRYNSGLNTFAELWSVALPNASTRTGTVLYDFEGDGNLEIVVRDQNQLKVLDASTGATRTATTCPSAGRMETPVVVDVDSSGQANIICGCSNSIKAFQTTSLPWTSARTVFNQRSYFALNINDDLSVPMVQQHQELGYPSNAPLNFPFNAFMQQTVRLANDGTPLFSAANDSITLVNPATDLFLARCQDGTNDSIGIRLTVYNTGEEPIPSGTLIAFYKNNPYLPGSVFLRRIAVPSAVSQGASLILPMIYVSDQGGSIDLYYQINDSGTNPIPISGPAVAHPECDYGNNLASVYVTWCGNTPPVIDTSGVPTDTILFTSMENIVETYCISALDIELTGYDVTGIIGTPAFGTVTGLSDGDSCVTLTPNLNTGGTTRFSLIVCDNGNVSLCDTVVFIWTVISINDRPVAGNDAVTTNEDTLVRVAILANDIDAENDPLAITLLAGPFHGNAILALDTITYTPSANYFGLDTIYYRVCDNGLPPGCDTATVLITVGSVNDAPIAQDDFASFPNDTTSIDIPVALNDSDVEGGILTIRLLCLPNNGVATLGSGTWIHYVPNPSYLGLDTLCYSICDTSSPSLCDTAFVYFNIFNGNEPPIAVDDDGVTLPGVAVVIDLLANDSDPNGQAFGITELSCGPNHATLVLDTLNGLLTYIPVQGYWGYDTVCYVICDSPLAGPALCDTAQVFIFVGSSNIPPVAVLDTVTIAFDRTKTINVLANDSDPNPSDSIYATIISQPLKGTVLLSNGIATYSPGHTFVGVDSFCYQLRDNGIPVLYDTACVYITVLPSTGLAVPNGFSPNGDGVNDLFFVNSIFFFPYNELKIFNRWGSTIYETKGYENDWDGTFNGAPVPDGTYFYRLDLGDGTPLTGFFLIYR